MQSETEGINKLRKGSLILILASIFITILVVILAFSLLSISPSYPSASVVVSVMGIVIGLIIVAIIGVIAGIIGIWNIKDGFKILRNLGKDVGIGYVGAVLYIVALILIMIGVSLVLIGGVFAVIFGAIVEIVSNILIGIGFYKVGEIYNEGITKIGGILVAIPVNIISFIGYILVYIGLGKIKPITTLTTLAQPGSTQMPLPQPTLPPQIYQVGQGIIRGDGYAQISLYSNTQATVLSARIDGTLLASVNINPVVLQSGDNEITIKFDNVSSLTPGTTYLITLVVNVGGNIREIKTAAVYQPS